MTRRATALTNIEIKKINLNKDMIETFDKDTANTSNFKVTVRDRKFDGVNELLDEIES